MSENETEKQGRVAQVRSAYRSIKSVDPKIGWWMLLAAAGAVVVAVAIGLLAGHWLYALIMSIPLAGLAAMFVMNRRGNTAMYKAIEGQPGATGATLQGMGKRGWYADTAPVAVDAVRSTKVSDMSGAAMVFRALGRPGIVLLGEGPKARVVKLLKAEEKKVTRVAPGVPIQTFVVGDGEGDLPLRKVTGKLTKMKAVLTKEETSVVNKRLKSLGGLRTGVPAGMDPTRARVDRKAMRGR